MTPNATATVEDGSRSDTGESTTSKALVCGNPNDLNVSVSEPPAIKILR